MRGRHLAQEIADPLRRLNEINSFRSEELVEFADELAKQYHRGGIPKDVYEALDDVVDKRNACLTGLPTII